MNPAQPPAVNPIRVGTLCFTTEQGLGILAKSFVDNGVVNKICTLAHGRRTEHPEWYAAHPGFGFHMTTLRDRMQVQHLKRWCESLDVFLAFETPFIWDIFSWCRERSIGTALMVMHECTPATLPTIPSVLFCPSLLDFDQCRKNFPDVPCATMPVPVSIPWRLRERALVFVHNAGHVGLRGRNGTDELKAAWEFVKSPVQLIIRYQDHGRNSTVRNAAGGVMDIRHGTIPYETLWEEGDVFIFPEKHNGLSLPMQEARAAGMLVMATDRHPNNKWLPTAPLIPISGEKIVRIGSNLLEYPEASVRPEDIAASIDKWYGQDISMYSLSGKLWREKMSWDALREAWCTMMSALSTSQR